MIELVIVVAITGIIAAIAVPRFGEASSGRRLQAGKSVILADIETAKLRARATSKQHVLKFYPDEEMYAIFEGNEVKRDALVMSRRLSDDPLNIEIHRTDLTGDMVAIITPFGDLSPPIEMQIVENSTVLQISIDGIADTGETPVIVDTVKEVVEVVDSIIPKVLGGG